MLVRTLGSAALAASLLAADLVILTLFLNPELTLRGEAPALLLALFLPYAAFGTAAFALVALLGTAVRFWPRNLRPPLPGLPWYTTFVFLALLAAAALFGRNLLSYRHCVPEPFVRALAASSLAIAGAALLVMAVGIDSLLFPTRGRGLSAVLVVLGPAAAVVVPLALRPAPPRPVRPVPLATETVHPVRRVILIGIDGLGPAQMREGVGSGNLPAFARLLKRGASGPLATLRPTEGPPVWTTMFTGRLPRDHGVKSFTNYRLLGSGSVYELLPKGALVRLLERAGLVSPRPVTSASRKRRTLWDALNAFGIPTGIVRFWGTHPPERVRGFMLSHYFDLLQKDPARRGETLYPPDLLSEVMARAVQPADVDRTLVSEFLDAGDERADEAGSPRRDLERALAADLTYQRAGAVLRAAYDPPFFATYFYGLDVVGHTFMRYAHPDRFGDVRAAEVRRYGRVLDRYTALLSQWVGETAQGLRPGEVLLVVSGYGMEPVPFWRRVLDSLTGATPMSGTHAGAPDGFILAVGDGVRAGATLRSASVLDVAPTVLYLTGLPVARDMEGRVLTEMLEKDFARAHPVTYIPSYESLAITPTTGGGDDLPLPPEEVP